MADTPEMITAFRGGRFCMVEAPEWWDWSIKYPVLTWVGGELDNKIEVSEISETGERGWLLGFDDGVHCMRAWVPTDADYLELMTTRAISFVQLHGYQPIAESLEHIRNAIIAFARHGSSNDIDLATGMSKTDMRAERDAFGRRVKRQAAERPVGPPGSA